MCSASKRGAASSSRAASACLTVSRATSQRAMSSGLAEGLVAERDRLGHNPVDGRDSLGSQPGLLGPLLEIVSRAQPAQRRERQH